MDIRNCFARYTQNTLSISAGIGIYACHYPIKRIAYETADMESLSKLLPGKNAVTIFENQTFNWDTFEKKVLGEKFAVISSFFDHSETRGRSFLYRLFELVQLQSERINFARFAYILSRLEPKRDAEKKKFRDLSSHMYQWIKSEEDSKQLSTAILLYVYLTRNKEEKADGLLK